MPEWMQELTRAQLPPYPPETDAVVLLDDESTVVKDNGDIATVHRFAAKILRPGGSKEVGLVVVPFDSETKLTYLKAWSLDAKGQVYEVKEKDAVETAMLDDNTYSDLRHKVLQIPAAVPGTIVGYEYQQRRRPYFLQDAWAYEGRLPVRKARFSVTLPPGWRYEAFWSNREKLQPTEAGTTLTWEVADVAGIEPQRSMPAYRAVAPLMVVNYLPSNVTRAATHGSWADVSTWAWKLVQGRRTGTPEIHARAVALTQGSNTPIEKIRALAPFAQREIRYVAVEIGIGGYQPHQAAEIFAHRYGDCKDKATLLSAMLKEVGIDSDYLLVHTDRGVVQPDMPSAASFNHVVLAIYLPPNVSTEGLPALYKHPKLGNILFFDPTDEFTPVGQIPTYLQASYGLLVREKDGELLKLPLHDPSVNQLKRTAKFTLLMDGTLMGKVEETRTGVYAKISRARLLNTKDNDRAKVLENFLSQFLGSFRLKSATVSDLDHYDAPLTIKYELEAPNYAKVVGNLLLVPPRVLGTKTNDILEDGKKRRFPVEFEEASSQFDSFEITLPPGYEIDEMPDATNAKYGFGEYSSKIAFDKGVLHYSRECQMKSVFVPLENVSELQKFYRQIYADERASAVLKKAN
jgi:Domain of Unknown Function with PDB structure (DUF3857)/Transglutaminase-like superfamily